MGRHLQNRIWTYPQPFCLGRAWPCCHRCKALTPGEMLSEQNMNVVFSHLSQKLIKLRFRHEDANIVKSPSQVILVNSAVLENWTDYKKKEFTTYTLVKTLNPWKKGKWVWETDKQHIFIFSLKAIQSFSALGSQWPCWYPWAWSNLCTSATVLQRSPRHRPWTKVLQWPCWQQAIVKEEKSKSVATRYIVTHTDKFVTKPRFHTEAGLNEKGMTFYSLSH